ncbi:unnamed protein product, partial [Scytosiphon promiscuus]
MGKQRPGRESAIQLMESDDHDEWEAAFRSYSRSVKRLSEEKGKPGLVELDQWWRSVRTTMPKNIVTDEGGAYLSKDDLVKLMQWKLWIGTNRPTLLAYAKATDAKQVKAKSSKAFQLLPRHSSSPATSSPRSRTPTAASGAAGAAPRAGREAVKKAVLTLTSDLKGVGPATASAILAAWCGSCPFDADEVRTPRERRRQGGKRAYSLGEYLEVREALDAKATSLGAGWDAERVRKALWSRTIHSRFAMEVPAVAPPPPASAATAASAAPTKTKTSSSPESARSASSSRGGGASSPPSRSKSRKH